MVDSKDAHAKEVTGELMNKIRASVIFMGALLGRFGEVTFSYPGGCDIGTRPIDLHLEGFRKLGAQVVEVDGEVRCKAEELVRR